MTLRVEFTIEAKADLDDLRAYLQPLNPSGLANVTAAIEQCILLAADFPASGRLSPRDDIREAVETKYGFLMPYAVFDNVLYVLRVYNGRRRPLNYGKLPFIG